MKNTSIEKKHIIVLIIVAILFILPIFNKPWLGKIHAENAYRDGISKYMPSSLAARKVVLNDGNSYYLYFESTNTITLSYSSWMITVVYTSDGEKYEKVEEFDYTKALYITINKAMERAWVDESSTTKEILLENIPKELKNLYAIFTASSLENLKKNLLLDGFVNVTK